MGVGVLRVVVIASGLLFSAVAWAGQIVVAQVASLGNPDTAGPHIRVGLSVYFDAVNHAGGVHGATIRFVSKDRGVKTGESVAKTRELLVEADPLVLTGLMGTGSMDDLVRSKILEEAGISVVGMRTGSVPLHDPVHPYLFHTRANYQGEVQKIVTQLETTGLHRVAVFYEKSPFGHEVLGLIQQELTKRPAMRLVHQDSYAANTGFVKGAVSSIHGGSPQSVIVVANSIAAAEFYKAYRAAGGKAQVLALSVADGGEVVKRIGITAARGLIVSQIVPDPNSALPLIRELRQNLARFAPPGTPVNHAVVEGYIMAKTVVQALRMAGPNPTRRKIRSALESMKEFDAGGVVIGFSPSNHTGAKYVELAIVLSSGKLMR